MKVKIKLLLEFGNSATRVIGIEQDRAFGFTMSNHFGVMEEPVFPKAYDNNKSVLFLSDAALPKGVAGEEGAVEEAKVCIAHGQYVEREFKGEVIRPAALRSKAETVTTLYTTQLAIIKCAEILAALHKTSLNTLELEIDYGVLMPPLDHARNEGAMIDLIKSVTEVEVVKPHKAMIKVKVGDVMVESEGVSAVFGAMFNETNSKASEADKPAMDLHEEVSFYTLHAGDNLVENPENSEFMTGYMMVIDIGGGTTEFGLFEKLTLIDRSKDTQRKGSNTVYSYVEKDIRRDYDIVPDDREMVMHQCLVEDSGVPIEVEDIVNRAKATVARGLVEDITKWLEVLTVSPRSIKGVLIVGGGSLPSIRDGVEVSPALSDTLYAYLQEFAPNLKKVSTKGKNVRLLNILGLYYISRHG